MFADWRVPLTVGRIGLASLGACPRSMSEMVGWRT